MIEKTNQPQITVAKMSSFTDVFGNVEWNLTSHVVPRANMVVSMITRTEKKKILLKIFLRKSALLTSLYVEIIFHSFSGIGVQNRSPERYTTDSKFSDYGSQENHQI